MSASEYDGEPIPGLLAALPAGERLLWQGTPRAWPLAVRALRLPWVAGYFCIIALWDAVSSLRAGHGVGAAAHDMGAPLLLGIAACIVLLGIGWAAARATVYSITDRRVVIRHGIALPMSLNLPFSRIEAVGLKLRRDGTGDLAIRVCRPDRVGYLLTWPHVRPGQYLQPQPTLRALAEPQRAAEVIAAALRSAQTVSGPSSSSAATAGASSPKLATPPVRVASAAVA